MNMDKLFKALPRDLQWEVLAVFVGSHVVRKGQLIKKINTFDNKFQLIRDMARIEKCYIEQYIQSFNTKSFVQLPNGSQLMFCECPYTGYMGYKFRQVLKRECSWMPKAYGLQYTSLTYSAPLPPFEKHSYPSYPDTDKKKAARFAIRVIEEEQSIVRTHNRRLSIIRPCDLAEYEDPYSFMEISPLTLGECRSPDEPLSTPYWRTTQFHLEMV
jgi:hypothetical protein